MVKDHSDSEKGNPLPPHRLHFSISSKGSFICTIPDRIAHTTAFVTPVVEHWLEREIAQWVHPMKDRSDDPSHHERTLLPRSYISLLHPMKDRSDDPSHHERTLLPRSYISLLHPMKDRSDDPSHHERTLLPRSYISLPSRMQIYKHEAPLTLSLIYRS